MANDSNRIAGIVLLAVAALLGVASLFVDWGTTSGGGYGSPLRCYQSLDVCFNGNAVTAGIGAILMPVATLLLAAAAVLESMGPRRGLALAFTADAAAFVTVAIYVVGLTLLPPAKQFPLAIGFWLGTAQVVLAFAAPLALKRVAAASTAMPMVGTPRIMRVTGPPAEPAAPAVPRRLKCPKCGTINMVGPGSRPACSKCGHGATPA